ncbi:MAG: small multi-drug export protein [Candidatus Diapherotrites archaeon]|nr:small multi-drug export protein [Candidatus Diapherotrites archaeon]
MLNNFLSFFSENNELLLVLFYGFAPISEVRGAAAYAFAVGSPELMVLGALANIAVAPVLIVFWNLLNFELIGRKIMGHRLEKRKEQLVGKYKKYGVFGLAFFIGIPLPITGVYSGVLVAKILGIENKQILIGSVLGVLMSSTIMFLLLSGFFSFF